MTRQQKRYLRRRAARGRHYRQGFAWHVAAITAIFGFTFGAPHMARAMPVDPGFSVSLNNLAPTFAGLSGAQTLMATPGSPASGALVFGGAVSLSVTAGGLISIVDTGTQFANLSADMHVGGSVVPVSDYLGLLFDTGSGIANPGHINSLPAAATDQLFWGQTTITAGSLTISEAGVGSKVWTPTPGTSILNTNLVDIANLGNLQFNFINPTGTGQVAAIDVSLEGGSFPGGGNPVVINGSLTECDSYSDCAQLNWAAVQVTGIGQSNSALDPAGPPVNNPPIALGADVGGPAATLAPLGLAFLGIGVWGAKRSQRLERERFDSLYGPHA